MKLNITLDNIREDIALEYGIVYKGYNVLTWSNSSYHSCGFTEMYLEEGAVNYFVMYLV